MMPQLHIYTIHDQGPALWPAHKPENEIRLLQQTTPPITFSATYQQQPTPPGGFIFKREFWDEGGRYDTQDKALERRVVGRWLSFDTGLRDKDTSAYDALVVGELTPGYKLLIRYCKRDRYQFPDLVKWIKREAARWNYDKKLKGVIIEDKSSGVSALQTLRQTVDQNAAWLSPLLIPFMPRVDKETRAQQAAVWAENGSVLLPHPHEGADWLFDLEDEIFEFPNGEYKDQVDAFAQLILYLEHLLAAGLRGRIGGGQEIDKKGIGHMIKRRKFK